MQKLSITLAVFLAFTLLGVGANAQENAKKPPDVDKTSTGNASAKKSRDKGGSATDATSATPAKQKKKSKKQLKQEAEEAEAAASKHYAEAVANLDSTVPATVLEAVVYLSTAENPESAKPLIKLLESGPRSDITDAAIFALGILGQPESVPILLSYLHHRRSDARIAALFALEKFKTPEVTAAIENALRDSDRQVRASAALALGKRGDGKSLPALFNAFERGVTDASISIGQLGSPDDAKRLIGYLGKEDIKVLLAGFEEFLNRDDFPENAKLLVLNRLFDLAGPDVWRFAVAYKATFPPETKEEDNKVYKLVCRMVRQIKDK